MRKLLLKILLLFAGTCFGFAEAQNLDFKFSRIPSYEKLASYNITSMAQQRDGYIWIGTSDGLCRFDGLDVKVYLAEAGKSGEGLSANLIRHLFVDSQNKLWVVTSGGIAVYNDSFDSFVSVITMYNTKGLPDIVINQILEDKKGRLNVAVGNSVYFYNTETDNFDILQTSNHGFVSRVFYDENGVWLGHHDGGGVSYYKNDDLVNYSIHLRNEILTDTNSQIVTGLDVDSNYVWIGIDNGGIVRINRENYTLKKYHHADSERYVFDFYRDINGNLWSFDYSGVKMYIAEHDYFHGYYHNSAIPYSIRPNIQGVFQDYQGNFYTFHSGEGIYVSYVSRGFQLFDTSDRHYWHLTSHNISSVAEDKDGNLWLGGFNGGIDVFDWANGRMLNFIGTENKPGQLGQGSILALYLDSKSNMWVGSHGGGLQRFVPETQEFESFRHIPGNRKTPSHNDIRSIVEDEYGNFWLAIHGKGVDYFNQQTGEFINFNTVENHLSSDWVNDVVLDDNNNLWVATAHGLNFLKKDAHFFVSYVENPDDDKSIKGNNVVCLTKGGENQIWAGTNIGLYLINTKTKTITRKAQNSSSQFIVSVEQDNNGILWLGTLGGLVRYNPKTDEIFQFDENDGIQGKSFNMRASYNNGNNYLVFAGTNGVTSFEANSLVYNESPPVVCFTGLSLFKKPVTDYGDDSPLSNYINYANEIVLDYNNNFITIDFAALNFINPLRNKYACKMEGFDRDWVHLGNRRDVTYTNLSPGTYTFRVWASNNDGVWNEEGIAIKVRVLAPWWKTIWFYAIVASVFLLGVYTFMRTRTARLRRQKKKLAHMVAESTRKLRRNNQVLKQRATEMGRINQILEERQKLILEQSEELETQAYALQKSNGELMKLITTKDKLFSIIAHDLRTPFNTILGFSSLLMEFSKMDDKEKIQEYSRYVNDASVLVYNLLENLLYWARSQTNEIHLHLAKIDLDEIVNENVGLIRESAMKKEITVDTSMCENFQVFADVNMMRTVVRNLLINAIKFTNRGGAISVKSVEVGGFVWVSVTDTGIGISKERLSSILTAGSANMEKGTEGEKGSGLGLMLCHEFILKNNGTLKIASELGVGSTFSFSIPIVK